MTTVRYKIISPISFGGTIYKPDDEIEISLQDPNYFGFWLRREQDKEVEILKEVKTQANEESVVIEVEKVSNTTSKNKKDVKEESII